MTLMKLDLNWEREDMEESTMDVVNELEKRSVLYVVL